MGDSMQGHPIKKTSSKPGAVAAALMSSACLAGPALAQEPGSVDEVVVTAMRTGETNLQQTPLSITALGAEALSERSIETTQDLVGAVPGLSISQANNGAQIFIRGVGSDNVFVGSDPSTTVHLDGVYLARPSMLFAELFDVQRVEVLRGPQGTLYGRNSAGGTINIVTRQPTAETDVRLMAEYGSYNRIRVGGYAAGSLVGEDVMGSIAFLSSAREGYVHEINPATPWDRLNSENTQVLRGALRLALDPVSELQLSLDLTRRDDTSSQDKPTLMTPDGTPVVGPQIITDPYTISTSQPAINELTSWGGSTRYTRELSPSLQFISLSAYRGLDTRFQVDNDFTELAGLFGLISEDQTQVSQEFQLIGNTERFRWITGLFFLNEDHQFDASISVEAVAEQLGVDEFLSLNDTHVDSTSYAAFVDGTFNFTDRFSLTAGLRYSHEEKDVVGIGTLVIDGAPSPDYEQDQSARWDSVTPRLVLSYQLSPEQLVYASVTRGFKSGGFNFTGNAPAFEPEYLWAYEVGLKADWLDNRLRTNLSGFYYDYTDLQVISHVEATVDHPTASNTTTNAATAHSMGAELELAAVLGHGFELSAGLAYLDAEYDAYLFPVGNPPSSFLDLSGNRLSNSPELTYSFGIEHSMPAGEFTLSSRLDWSWRDQVFFTAFNSPVSSQAAYGLLSGRVALAAPGEHWEFSLYGRNLTDEAYSTAVTEFSPFGVTKKIAEPRTFGLQLNWRN